MAKPTRKVAPKQSGGPPPRRAKPAESAKKPEAPLRKLASSVMTLHPPRDTRPPLKIVLAASEMVPYAKTGGLADVMGALPKELVRLGHRASVFIPFYRGLRQQCEGNLKLRQPGAVPIGDAIVSFEVWETTAPGGVTVYLIRRDDMFDRAGLYGENGMDYADNARRWIFFSKAVAEAMDLLKLEVDLVHVADWHAALIPYLMGRNSWRRRNVRTAITIHNAAFQGVFDSHDFRLTNLANERFSPQWLEFYGRLNLLKGAIMASDLITTVSERYAAEIQTPEYGFGLDPVLKHRAASLFGILNGVDTEHWNPETDPHLARNYSANTVDAGKLACKKALLAELGLKLDPSRPLLGCISRLTGQKGIDFFGLILPWILARRDAGLVVLGMGEPHLEESMEQMQRSFPERVSFRKTMDDGLAHRIEAGCDFYLMPSRFEPCGLNQMYSLIYGTVPIVRATGGLDDTVTHFDPATRRGNGFKFSAHTPNAFRACIDEALSFYDMPEDFRALRVNGMSGDFSWTNSAKKYVELFRRTIAGR